LNSASPARRNGMIECPKCGARRVRPGAQFCDQCGARVPNGMSKLVSETEELRAQVKRSEALQGRIATLESTLKARSQELGPLRARVLELETENKELKAKAETEHARRERPYVRVKDLEPLQRKIAALESDNRELRTRVGSERAEHENLQNRVREFESLQTKVAALEVENSELETFRTEVRKRKRETGSPYEALSHTRRYLGVFLIAFGIFTVLASMTLGIVNLSGLGLASFLIGLLVVYLPSPSAVPPELMEASMLSSVGNLERVLRELGPETKAVYLAVHDRLDVPTVFLPLSDNPTHSLGLASLDADRFLVMDSSDAHKTGLVLEAPGASLLALMEKESGVEFFDTGREGLLDALRSGMTESLEIATDIRGTITEDPMKLRIKDGPLSSFVRSVTKSAPTLSSRLGCPICSAAVCALVKVTKQDITLEEATHESGYHSLSLRLEGDTTDETR